MIQILSIDWHFSGSLIYESAVLQIFSLDSIAQSVVYFPNHHIGFIMGVLNAAFFHSADEITREFNATVAVTYGYDSVSLTRRLLMTDFSDESQNLFYILF